MKAAASEYTGLKRLEKEGNHPNLEVIGVLMLIYYYITVLPICVWIILAGNRITSPKGWNTMRECLNLYNVGKINN